MQNLSLKTSILIIVTVFKFFIIKCEERRVDIRNKEIECFSENKIYHIESDKCYKLLTRGPCEPGYWFVLEKPMKEFNQELKISAICNKEKCPEGNYYWPRTKSCVKAKDKNRLCGSSSDEELLNNVFGEAECRCARNPPRARFDGNENNKCYQLYAQGPCRPGQIFGYASKDLQAATCIEDRCYEETIKRRNKGSLSKHGILAPWINGTCYELGTQGPCEESLEFKVHETTLKPDCVSSSTKTSLFDLDKPQNCYQDENGDCQKKINKKNQSANKYKEDLFNSLNAARKKRASPFSCLLRQTLGHRRAILIPTLEGLFYYYYFL